MNIERKWQQLLGKIQQQWWKLTNDDLQLIDGKHKELAGKAVEHHGIAKEQAKKDMDSFISSPQLRGW